VTLGKSKMVILKSMRVQLKVMGAGRKTLINILIPLVPS